MMTSHTTQEYLPALPVFPGVFFIKSPGLSERLLDDFRGLFLDIVSNDILTMQRFLDISVQIFVLWGLAGMITVIQKL